jgi:hypothetical protein
MRHTPQADGGDHLVVVGVLACGGTGLHGGGCWLGVLLRRGLCSALVGYGSGVEVVMVVLGGALLLLLDGGALHLSFEMSEMGPQVAPSKSSVQPLAVPGSLTPLGADYLVKGVAAMFLSSPWRSSGASAWKHPSWSFGSGSWVVLIALMSGFVLSSLGCPISQVFRWCPQSVVYFMYYRCGCSYTKLFFYLNAIYARHTLEKKVNNIKGRVRRFTETLSLTSSGIFSRRSNGRRY